jgi:hypothetical protein
MFPVVLSPIIRSIRSWAQGNQEKPVENQEKPVKTKKNL